jgi:hypothetical protein
LQDPQKCTQIGIFGLKMCHLATLFQNPDFIPLPAEISPKKIGGSRIGWEIALSKFRIKIQQAVKVFIFCFYILLLLLFDNLKNRCLDSGAYDFRVCNINASVVVG